MTSISSQPPTAQRSEVPPDRSSPIPLYLQIAQRLHHDIAVGQLRPGATIGSEAALTKRFGVSRVTLRQAIALLVDQGIVSRRHGKGTFVEAAPLDYPLDALVGTTQVFSALGREWRSEVASLQTTRAGEDTARLLQLRPTDRVTRITRVDYAGRDALAVAHIQLPETVGKKLGIRDIEAKPLYPLLSEKAGERADLAHQTMRAAAASREVSSLIGIDEGAPVMVVSRVTHNSNGRPIEYSEVYFRADSIRFLISLRRTGDDIEYAVRYQEHRVASHPPRKSPPEARPRPRQEG